MSVCGRESVCLCMHITDGPRCYRALWGRSVSKLLIVQPFTQVAITWPLNNEDLTTETSVSILQRGSITPFLRHTSAVTVAWTETWPTFVLVVQFLEILSGSSSWDGKSVSVRRRWTNWELARRRRKHRSLLTRKPGVLWLAFAASAKREHCGMKPAVHTFTHMK